MRLLLDLQALQGHARDRGLGRYSLEFAAALSARPEVSETVVLISGGLGSRSAVRTRATLAERLPGSQVITFDAPWPWTRGDAHGVDAHIRAERVRDQLVRELRPDVVVVCSLFELPMTSVISIEEGGPFTATIGYDLLTSTEPACAWPGEWQDVYEHRMASMRSCDLILAISDHSGEEFRRFLGRSCPPVRTIWGAAGELRSPDAVTARPLSERAGVLCAGGADPRKNQVSTLKAYARLPDEVRRLHPLIVQGHRSMVESRQLMSQAERLGLDIGQVKVLGTNLDSEALHNLFATSRLVSMPSLGEGLGLPVLEAWAVGTPAIASSTTSLGEVVGDSRWTFFPTDVDAQASLMERLLGDDSAWEEARAFGEGRAESFTWELTAERAMHAILAAHPRYRHVLDPEPRRVREQRDPAEPRRSLLWVSGSGSSDRGSIDPMPAALHDWYDVTVDDGAGSLDPSRFERVVFDLRPGQSLSDVVDRMMGTPGVLALDDPEGVWSSLTHDLPSSVTTRLAYQGAGIRGLRDPCHAGLSELARSSLGILARAEDAYSVLTRGPGGLPHEWIQVTGDAGGLVATALESFYAAAPAAPDQIALTDWTLAALARNRPDRTGWALYCDVTRPRDHPGRSGIQRVTAALARNLVDLNAGRTFLVGLRDAELEHELSLLGEFIGIHDEPMFEGGPVAARPGDVLLLTEINPEAGQWQSALGEWRARGGLVVQVVHDLLPITLEDFFPNAKAWFTDWLTVFTAHADVLVCDSEASARDLRAWLAQNPPDRTTLPEVTWMRLGYDLGGGSTVRSQRGPSSSVRRRVLMVGTIEPRKGVEVLLDAAEGIWAEGDDVEFVVVGRPGWAMPGLLDRLGMTADSEERLTWLKDATDTDLLAEYERADLLVMPSRGEGFGLPIVEALAHGVPVIARDIPVFRELLGDTDSYFSRDADLAGAIRRRLADTSPAEGAPARLVTWRETAEELLGIIERHRSRGGRPQRRRAFPPGP